MGGGLLIWATQSEAAEYRGENSLAPGVVKLLLDGQQRITSLYGIIRGKAPAFFDGNAQAFTGIQFHLGIEEFAFYSPVKMRDDPLWIDVSDLMTQGLDASLDKLNAITDLPDSIGTYMKRLIGVYSIRDTNLHIEEVTGDDKSIDVVVDIFNRVNSGGTKLSKGDLALAKICAEAPDARDRMKRALKKWRDAEHHFDLDWLLRSVNTVITGEAKFEYMHNLDAQTFEDGLKRAEKAIDYLLNLISGRLGLDHDRVFFGRYAMPVMTHYLDRRGGHLNDVKESDKLLFWYLQCAMWGRFSGSTESVINRDLKAIEQLEGGLDRLIEELRLWRGSLRVQPDHFGSWGKGARFYPTLYLLSRVGEAKDWGSGLALTSSLLGKLSQLEVHHIFPRAFLYKHGYSRPEVNAVANFCFLTKSTNLQISDHPPEVYFEEVEENHPGALASQWIPMDRSLWKIENYPDFLKERRQLLADAVNAFLAELLHGAPLLEEEIEAEAAWPPTVTAEPPEEVLGGIDTEAEEELLVACNEWVVEQGLPEGSMLYELADESTGAPLAVFDLAWPNGVQEELSEPVAVLVNETPDVHQLANSRGFHYFTSVDAFKRYIMIEILGDEEEPQAA